MKLITDVQNLYKQEVGYAMCYSNQSALAIRISAIHCIVSLLWSVIVCKFRGHIWIEEDISVENGSGCLVCSRCGESRTYQW